MELLSLAHHAVDRLAQGFLRGKIEMDKERLLLAGTWCQVQVDRATAVSDELCAAEETKRLEEHQRDHARDLDARLFSPGEELAQLHSERDAVRAEMLGLKEGRDAALAAFAQVQGERDDIVAAITQVRKERDDATAAVMRAQAERDDATAVAKRVRGQRDDEVA